MTRHPLASLPEPNRALRPRQGAAPAPSSTGAASARRSLGAACALALAVLAAAPATAQTLPKAIEFAFTDSQDHGSFCREQVKLTFVGDTGLWEPIKRTCGRRNQSFPPDQGQIYPLNGSSTEERDCQVSAGRFPKMTCENGEKKTLRQRAATPFAVHLTTLTQGSLSGGVLKLATKVTEDRTHADGVKENVTFSQAYEFRISATACEFRKISRQRFVDGSNRSAVAINTGACRVLN